MTRFATVLPILVGLNLMLPLASAVPPIFGAKNYQAKEKEEKKLDCPAIWWSLAQAFFTLDKVESCGWKGGFLTLDFTANPCRMSESVHGKRVRNCVYEMHSEAQTCQRCLQRIPGDGGEIMRPYD